MGNVLFSELNVKLEREGSRNAPLFVCQDAIAFCFSLKGYKLISRDDFCKLGAPDELWHQQEALNILIEMAENAASLVPGGDALFLKDVFTELWNDREGQALDPTTILDRMGAGKKVRVSLIRRNLRRESAYFWAAAAWAVAALRPMIDVSMGRHCVMACNHIYGIYLGLQMAREASVPLMKISMLGSDARQKDNRADRHHVFEWCDKHMPEYASMNKAADALHDANEVSVERDTIRTWMTAWKKERDGRA